MNVYPPTFTIFKLKGLIQESNTNNLIHVHLKPRVTINANTDRLVFEFQTQSLSGESLFTDTLGYSYQGEQVLVEVIAGSACN